MAVFSTSQQRSSNVDARTSAKNRRFHLLHPATLRKPWVNARRDARSLQTRAKSSGKERWLLRWPPRQYGNSQLLAIQSSRASIDGAVVQSE